MLPRGTKRGWVVTNRMRMKLRWHAGGQGCFSNTREMCGVNCLAGDQSKSRITGNACQWPEHWEILEPMDGMWKKKKLMVLLTGTI